MVLILLSLLLIKIVECNEPRRAYDQQWTDTERLIFFYENTKNTFSENVQ